MADFAPSDLLTAAFARYGAAKLRARIRGSGGALAAVPIVNGGTGYTVATVAFAGGGGSGAAGTVNMAGGIITSITLTNPGVNYLTPPVATITGNGVNGAANTTLVADVELLRIAFSVISRAQAAAQAAVGWPLPGNWPTPSFDEAGNVISNLPYSQVWPRNLLENALELFNWRTMSGLEQVPDNAKNFGAMAEAYFVNVSVGKVALGLGTDADVGQPVPLAARDRTGKSLLSSVPDQTNVLDTFVGPAWDGF